jgi:Ca2+-binding EF-hand superfamily protein
MWLLANQLTSLGFAHSQAMRAFIEANFKMMDINSDGVIGLEEFRYNCIQRLATDEIKVVDDAFNALLNVSRTFHPTSTPTLVSSMN